MNVEELINKAIDPLDRLVRHARELLPEYREHPDAIRLTKAHDAMPTHPNFNDPNQPNQ